MKNNTAETKDPRIMLLDALLRYAQQSGASKPSFYQDEALSKLGICENVFLDQLMEIGDRCCFMNECHEGRIQYGINVGRCMEMHKKVSREQRSQSTYRLSAEYTILGTLVLIFVMCFII